MHGVMYIGIKSVEDHFLMLIKINIFTAINPDIFQSRLET